MVCATYIEDSATWEVKTENDEIFGCRWLIAATGTSYKQYIPEWKGLSSFEGTICHPAHWPEEPFPLEGKRVAVIGSGSTGLQVLQATSKVCSHATHFVRSPNIAIPMRQRAISEDEWYAYKPQISYVFPSLRATRSGVPMLNTGIRFSENSIESRKARMEEGWKRGGLHW